MTVSNDGIGLPLEKLKDLNEKTHYMDSSDDRLNLRHGLGLILVRRITEVHSGTIMSESQAGQGFKTVIKIPMQ